MKQYTKLIIAIATVLALFSCKEKEIGCVAISVDEADILFDFKSSVHERTATGGPDLRASSDQRWCAASILDRDEDNLRVRVLANPTEKPRYANVTLSASGCENVVLKVIQAGLEESDEPYLIVDRDDVEVKDTECSEFVTVASNVSPVTVVSYPDWCVPELLADKKTENLRLDFSANTSDKNRTGKVVLGAAGCEDVVVNVAQSRLLSKECDLLTFGLKASGNALEKDIDFDFDKEARTLEAMYLKWIDKADPAMLIPTFTMTGAKVMVGETEVVSGQTAISFADDFDFTVVAENGDTKSWRVSLNCPQINTELPVLRFVPDGGDITSKEYPADPNVAIELYSPLTAEGWWSTSGGAGKVYMKGRGNSTWELPKKPYAIKFTKGFRPVGLNHANAKKWTLLAHDMDKSLMRNALGFELSREMFNPAEDRHDPNACLFTPCTRFINVYKNNSYHGVYQMSDQVKQDKERINVEKLQAIDGSDPAKITGGYIVECDIHPNSGPSDWTSSKGIKWTIKYPEDDNYDYSQYRYIQDFINSAEAALYGSNFKDPVNGWRKWFDEKTLVDFMIVKELAGDMDGFTSIYIYKKRGVDKLFFGPIWDVDKGWRNDNRTPHWEYRPAESLMIYAGFWMNYRNPDWFHKFWQDEAFRAAVNARWKQKKDALLARIYKYLDEQPAAMSKAIEANFEVWPWNYQKCQDAPLPQSDYAAEIQYLRDLTKERAKVLDREFAR